MRTRRKRLNDVPDSVIEAFVLAHQVWNPRRNVGSLRSTWPSANEEHYFFHFGEGPNIPGPGGHGINSNRRGSSDWGRIFLAFHRYYLRKFEDWLGGRQMPSGHVLRRPQDNAGTVIAPMPEPRVDLAPLPYADVLTALPNSAAVYVGLNPDVLNLSPGLVYSRRYEDVNPTDAAATVENQVQPFQFTSLRQFVASSQLGQRIGPRRHINGHVGYGGRLGQPPVTTTAPAFYLWHAYIDRIWAEWQELCVPPPLTLLRGNPNEGGDSSITADLFSRCITGEVLWNRLSNGVWQGWQALGTVRTVGRFTALQWGDVATATGPASLWLFARRLYGGIVRRRLLEAGVTLQEDWEQVVPETLLPVAFTSDPALVAHGSLGDAASEPVFYLFVKGSPDNRGGYGPSAGDENLLYRASYDAGVWNWTETAETCLTRPVPMLHGATDATTGPGYAGPGAPQISVFFVDGERRLRRMFRSPAGMEGWAVETVLDDCGVEDPVVAICGSPSAPSLLDALPLVFCRSGDGRTRLSVPISQSANGSAQWNPSTLEAAPAGPVAFKAPTGTLLIGGPLSEGPHPPVWSPLQERRIHVIGVGATGRLHEFEWIPPGLGVAAGSRNRDIDAGFNASGGARVILIGNPADLSGAGGSIHCFIRGLAGNQSLDWTADERAAILRTDLPVSDRTQQIPHEPYVCSLLHGWRSASVSEDVQWYWERLPAVRPGPARTPLPEDRGDLDVPLDFWPLGGYEADPSIFFRQCEGIDGIYYGRVWVTSSILKSSLGDLRTLVADNVSPSPEPRDWNFVDWAGEGGGFCRPAV